jgi:hypothetical protein
MKLLGNLIISILWKSSPMSMGLTIYRLVNDWKEYIHYLDLKRQIHEWKEIVPNMSALSNKKGKAISADEELLITKYLVAVSSK